MKRVGIVGLLHESNTFVDGATTLEDFEADLLLEGEGIRGRMESAPHEVGGFFAGLAEGGMEAVPVFLARALPYGTIEAASFSTLVDRMLEALRRAGPLDGVLAAPHGATVAKGVPDADGYWLGRVRDCIGEGIPLIATIDPHANLSPQMVRHTDALIAYRTNPHLDQRETGMRAARLVASTLRGEIRPVQAAAFPTLAINIQSQNTGKEPLKGLYEAARAVAGGEGIVSHSIVLGFPYADVGEMGSSALVVTDNDPGLAEETVRRIAAEMETRKESFEPEFLSVAAAVQQVQECPEGPVVLLDMGDNVGGGSPADGTSIAREWIENGEGRGLVILRDPESVQQAVAAGEGAVETFALGDPAEPIRGTCRVLSLHDGFFREEKPRHGGFSECSQGDTAVLETVDGKMTVMLTSRRMAPFSLSQLTSFGIDPSRFRMIVAKGVIAPLAAYAPVAKGGFLAVDSPGVTRADMRKLDYVHRRRPLFPFE